MTEFENLSIAELEEKAHGLQRDADALRERRVALKAALSAKLREQRVKDLVASSGLDATVFAEALGLKSEAQDA